MIDSKLKSVDQLDSIEQFLCLQNLPKTYLLATANSKKLTQKGN